MSLKKKETFFIAAFAIISIVHSEIPSYINVCKRNHPDLNQCIINSIQKLLPKLKAGIPELDIPALEPLRLPEIVVSRGGAFKAVGSDILVRGASNFQIKSLKSDINKIEYQVSLLFPEMSFDGIYDVDAKILTLPIQGRGPIHGVGTDIEGTGIINGHKQTHNGKTHVIFDKLELKLKMKNYTVRLENLFNGDKALGEAVNAVLNDNKKELMRMIRPRAQEVAASVLLNIANNITKHFEYDELFPLK